MGGCWGGLGSKQDHEHRPFPSAALQEEGGQGQASRRRQQLVLAAGAVAVPLVEKRLEGNLGGQAEAVGAQLMGISERGTRVRRSLEAQACPFSLTPGAHFAQVPVSGCGSKRHYWRTPTAVH